MAEYERHPGQESRCQNSETSAAGAVRETVADLRGKMDVVDDALLDLVIRRAQLSRRMGEAKRQEQGGTATESPAGSIYQPDREQAILDRLTNRAEDMGGVLPSPHIASIWREIFSSSRALQQNLRVAFLGPEGTFSHLAARECLGSSGVFLPMDTFQDIFRAVHNGACDMGLVPLENTLYGSVGQSLDLFAGHAVHIVGEHYSRITHCLMSQEEELARVQKVYSHPQPLGQCAGWLRAHLPMASRVAESSTAAAARRAAGEAGSAAIGHASLAARFHLHILASTIEDNTSNWTRFALLAPGEETAAPHRDWHMGEDDSTLKTSLLFTIPDQPGSLARALALVGKGGINMFKLESRPIKDNPWQYAFFVDVGGNLLQSAHKATMEELAGVCRSVRVLGVYPRGRRADFQA